MVAEVPSELSISRTAPQLDVIEEGAATVDPSEFVSVSEVKLLSGVETGHRVSNSSSNEASLVGHMQEESTPSLSNLPLPQRARK
jgi:hypothetical protein